MPWAAIPLSDTVRAIVYSQGAVAGVTATELSRPRLRQAVGESGELPLAPRVPSQASLRSSVGGALLGAVRSWGLRRSGLPRDTPWYGALPERKYVLCRVHAAGVNPVDAKFLYGDKAPAFLLPQVLKKIEGSVCGIDFSGVVEEAEAGSGFSVGDRVFGTVPPLGGTFAEVIRVPTDSLARMPENLDFAQACVIPLVGLTALQAFQDNRLQPGQHVLILGASGGTGHVAVQIAKAMGAIVTAVCGRRNREFVKSLGADETLSYDTDDLDSHLIRVTREHGKFHLVFDTVSSHDPRDSSFAYETRIRRSRPALMDPQGRYIFIGGQVGDWIRAHCKRFLHVDLFAPGRELFWVRFPNSRAQLETLRELCGAGKLAVSLTHTLPLTLDGVREAFALQMSRRTTGKIALVSAADLSAPGSVREENPR